MAFIIKDRVKEGTTSTGTGAITLSGAAATFDTFQSYMTNGDTTYYAIVHTSSGVDEWEVGLGTWNTGNTLTRTTVLAGSNGTSAEDFSEGSKDVFMTYPAAHAALAGDDVDFANITVTGTVDGRDVATDGSKLDTVEQNADVTDAINVAAAGALMKSGGTMTGNLILNGDPTVALGAATKEYVDTIAAAGIHYHTPVRVEAPLNLTVTYNNGTAGVGATLTNAGTQEAITIDGVALSSGDRVLVYEQTDATQNGIYTVTTVGDGSTNWVLTRSTDADSYGVSDPNAFGEGDAFFVKEGATGAGELYVMNTSGTITFGTTNITFTIIAETAVYSAGTGLTLTNTTFAIGQDVGTTANVTFNQVTAAIIGDVDGNVDGDVTGNAGTATKLATARTIQLSGDVTGSATFDGSANASITAVVQDDSHSHIISNVDGLQTALNNKTPTSRTITAGNGLTGGGDLTANRTLNVGAGTGVIVTADTVAIGQAVGPTDDVTFGNVTADVFIAEGGSFTSNIETNTTSAIVIAKGYQILSDDGNYLRNIVQHTTGGEIHVGQSNTALITGINLIPGSSGKAEVGGVEIITTAGGGLTKSNDTLSHADTSSQASVDNSNGTVIQDITLDTYGHITGISSANLDGRYYTETEADSRFVNVTGDTMSGNLTVSIPDSGSAPAMTAEFKLRGYEGRGAGISIRDQANSASGATDREWFIGSGYNQSGFNIGYSSTGSQASYTAQNKLSLNTAGDAIFSGTIHAQTNQRVFADNYHPNADKWTTARTLTLSGDASGSVSWDGSADATLSVTVANDSHNHGHSDGDFTVNGGNLYTSTSQQRVKLSVWSDTTYGIGMKSGYTFGGLNNDYAMSFQMNSDNDRGFWWGDADHTDAQGAMALTTDGVLNVANNIAVGYGESDITRRTTYSLDVNGTAGVSTNLTLGENLLVGSNKGIVNSGAWTRLSTTSGYIEFGPANTNWAHIYTDRPAFYFNKELYVNNNRVYNTAYHPEADKWTTARTLSLSGDASGSVSWDGSANATLSVAVADDSHNHSSSSGNFTVGGDLIATDILPPTDNTGVVGNSTYTWNNGQFTNLQINSTLTVRGAVDLADNDYLRLGSGDDFRMWHNGTNTYFRNYLHAAGSFYWQGEGTGGTNHNLISMHNDVTAPYVRLYYDGSTVLETVSGGVNIPGNIAISGTVDGRNVSVDGTKLDNIAANANNYSLPATPSVTGINIGSQVNLAESSDRADLLQITSSTSSWAGLQIRNSSNEGRWSFMTDGAQAGFYDDENNHWAVQMDENGGVRLSHDNVLRFNTLTDGVDVSGTLYVDDKIVHNGDTDTYTEFHAEDQWRVVCGGTEILEVGISDINVASHIRMNGHFLDMNNNDIIGVDQIMHEGDSNTYIQFHAADQWRVVTGGVERLEVNNSQITSTEPIHAPSFHGDGSSLTGIASGANNDIFWENGQAVTSSYTITNGKNAMSAGPITINSGVTVTVGAGETWTVV